MVGMANRAGDDVRVLACERCGSEPDLRKRSEPFLCSACWLQAIRRERMGIRAEALAQMLREERLRHSSSR